MKSAREEALEEMKKAVSNIGKKIKKGRYDEDSENEDSEDEELEEVKEKIEGLSLELSKFAERLADTLPTDNELASFLSQDREEIGTSIKTIDELIVEQATKIKNYAKYGEINEKEKQSAEQNLKDLSEHQGIKEKITSAKERVNDVRKEKEQSIQAIIEEFTSAKEGLEKLPLNKQLQYQNVINAVKEIQKNQQSNQAITIEQFDKLQKLHA